MFRSIAALIIVLLCGAPAAAQTPPDDRAALLTKTWTCRTDAGSIVRDTGVAGATRLTVSHAVTPRTGDPYTLTDTYEWDSAHGLWRVVLGGGSPLEFVADAPPWTGSTWQFDGRSGPGLATRVRIELVADGNLRRTFLKQMPDGAYMGVSSSLCAPGDSPPPAA